jgi:5-deoxy-glucuronate isomerase
MNWFKPRGTLAAEGWNAVVDGTIEGWRYTGLRVADLEEGESRQLAASSTERIIVPLWGSFDVVLDTGSDRVEIALEGRRGPFFGPTDVVYASVATAVEIRGIGRVAVAEGPASQSKPWRHVAANEVPVEIRGAGQATRQVHNFGTPDTLDADRLIVCEVITPSANWSSFPSHKHDVYIPGVQSNLEEIYYFESSVARGFDAPETAEPVGYFRNYGTDERPIDTLAEVRSGDVALVPHGWHGPATAAPGYDLYYLNIMAGPDPDRSWNIEFDARHGWLNEAWKATPQDSRLPYLSEETQ